MLWRILGAPYAEVLERKEFTLRFSEDGFAVQYFDRSLPVDPATYGSVISHVQRTLGTNDACAPLLDEIAPIGALVQGLPPSTATDADEISRRYRERDEL